MSSDCSSEIGCMIGLALGDALCAPCEGGLLERGLWRLLGMTKDGRRRYTDDTQMAIDVAHSLISTGCPDPEHLASTFARSYRWRRGYGPGTARILKKIRKGRHWADVNRSVHRDGSFGNGAAMRIPPLALFYRHRRHLLADAVEKCSVVTHAHPLAVEGAQIIGACVLASFDGKDRESIIASARAAIHTPQFTAKISALKDLLHSVPPPSPKRVASRLGNGIPALESCVTAVYVALRFAGNDFSDMIRFVQRLGGDADTIGAMAGAVWGSRRGLDPIPEDLIQSVEGTESIMELTRTLCRKGPE